MEEEVPVQHQQRNSNVPQVELVEEPVPVQPQQQNNDVPQEEPMEEPVPIKPQQQNNDVLQRELIEEPVPVQPCLQQQNSNLQVEDQLIQSIHVWSAYNSHISSPTHVTKVGAPPLTAAPAHEWPTLLTILMQAQHITTKVVGPDRKAVISLDMGLYQPAKKLQMS